MFRHPRSISAASCLVRGISCSQGRSAKWRVRSLLRRATPKADVCPWSILPWPRMEYFEWPPGIDWIGQWNSPYVGILMQHLINDGPPGSRSPISRCLKPDRLQAQSIELAHASLVNETGLAQIAGTFVNRLEQTVGCFALFHDCLLSYLRAQKFKTGCAASPLPIKPRPTATRRGPCGTA